MITEKQIKGNSAARMAELRMIKQAKRAQRAAAQAAQGPDPPPQPKIRQVVIHGGEYRQRENGIIEAYGAVWPVGTHPAAIEAGLYADDDLRSRVPDCQPRHLHFIRFCKHLVSDKVFLWHRWAYEGAELWCERGWTCIGAAGTGKSAMFGLFVLADWLADPANTVTVLVSTTIDMLKARIWMYVCKWYEALPEQFRAGHFRQANPLGLLYVAEPTEQVPNPQWLGAGIICVGFKQGDKEEVIKNHLGRHLKRNRIIVDELQGVNRAVLDIWWNMGASGQFKFGGFGNPQSMFDPLGEASAPSGHVSTLAAFDWLHATMMGSGHREEKKWKTRLGYCLMFDGLDCPTLDDKRFHWLINQEHIDNARAAGGENSVLWYIFVRGIFPPTGGLNTLVSGKEITECGANETMVAWDGPTQYWLWGDLAHGGEDEAGVQRVRVGRAVGGRIMILLMERTLIEVDVKKGLISQQIGRRVAAIAREHNVSVDRMAIDATGTQGASIDAIEVAMKAQGIVRIHASGPASKNMPVKLGWPQSCVEAYDNRAAELAGNFREFLRAGQIRGVDAILAQQASSRVTLPQEEVGGVLKLHPDKKAGNGGKSPTALDIVCIGCTALRERGGIHPGTGAALVLSVAGRDQWEKAASRLDIRGRGRLRSLLQRY